MSDPSETTISSEPVLLQKFNHNIEEAINFYTTQVNRLLTANHSLTTKLQTSLQQKKELADKIYELEKSMPYSSQDDKKKRVRRCANQIRREFICKAEKCGKSYGSEGSLLQHIKLKHPASHENKNEMREQTERQN